MMLTVEEEKKFYFAKQITITNTTKHSRLPEKKHFYVCVFLNF